MRLYLLTEVRQNYCSGVFPVKRDLRFGRFAETAWRCLFCFLTTKRRLGLRVVRNARGARGRRGAAGASLFGFVALFYFLFLVGKQRHDIFCCVPSFFGFVACLFVFLFFCFGRGAMGAARRAPPHTRYATGASWEES